MLKKAFFVLGIMFFLFPVFAQESDDEPYLSIAYQEAILDEAADAIIDATVTVEHKQDSEPVSQENIELPEDTELPYEDTEPSYLVRIEIYSRIKTPYIPVGDLSLEPGFLSWTHDGREQNGYAVYMYPVKENISRITAASGVTLLYGKSFSSAEEAIAEIRTNGSAFNRLVRYRPVVEQMVERLKEEPYQGDSK
jgi:hypothetical protein